MLYKSTRGQSPEVSFSEVLLGGLAPDGGLYMPTSIPKFSIEEINDFKDFANYYAHIRCLCHYRKRRFCQARIHPMDV